MNSLFHGRRAVQIENEFARVTVTSEGGHIAELLEKTSGVNPLWVPPWKSIEPSAYSLASHPEYGADAESKLLAGILGHNLCLDLFGPPSKAEAAAGLNVHGEAGIIPWQVAAAGQTLTCACVLPLAQLAFERTIQLLGRRVLIAETVENLSTFDRPIAWTQHVTLGPPFIARGKTQFRASATQSRALGESSDFNWPLFPRGGVVEDLQTFTNAASSAAFTSHLMNPASERAWFLAWSPASNACLGYAWNRADFPWLGIWEENHDRTNPPWNGETITRGMEFGVSPVPEPRQNMIERAKLFDTPAYRWIAAKTKLSVKYYAAVLSLPAIPESLEQFETHLNAK